MLATSIHKDSLTPATYMSTSHTHKCSCRGQQRVPEFIANTTHPKIYSSWPRHELLCFTQYVINKACTHTHTHAQCDGHPKTSSWGFLSLRKKVLQPAVKRSNELGQLENRRRNLKLHQGSTFLTHRSTKNPNITVIYQSSPLLWITSLFPAKSHEHMHTYTHIL